ELLDAKLAAEAEEQARQNEANQSVNDLFKDNDPTKDIKETTTQRDINEAQAKVDKVTDATIKEELQKAIDKAQELLDAKLAAEAEEQARQNEANQSVNDLFKDNDPTKDIKETTTQRDINEAQAKVDKVTDATIKEELQKEIDKAQEQLDNQTATIEKPHVNSVTNNDTVVTGTGKPGLIVTVNNGTTSYTSTVAANGTFTVTIPQQKADTILTVTQKNASTTSETVNIKVTNYMPTEKVTLNPVGPFQQAITGKAPAGTKSVRLIVNGVPQRLVTPEADGSFSIYSRFVTDGTNANLRLQAGDIVAVDYGIRTPANLVATTIVNKEHVKPVVHDIKANADYVTGFAPVGTQVLRLVVNGIPQRTITPQANIETVVAGGIASDGKFKIYSRFIKDENGINRKLQAGDKVIIDSGVQIPGDTGTTVTVTE
uniref:toxin Cry1Ac domain D-VI-related protein n=1 Tax=Listeria rocourtiae TaxID=647910 RepID=UPI003D2F7528